MGAWAFGKDGDMARITIKDIARELGISPSTVSRALREHPDISPRTRERVREIAERHNYQPNQIAKSLQTRRSNTIGVIVPEIQHFFFSAVISGIEALAYDAGYAIMVCQSNETYEREVFNTRVLAAHQVAGLIASVSKETTEYGHLKNLIRQSMPLVLYDRVVDGLDVGTVVVDDFNGAYKAVSYLLDAGYKRIAHLAGPGTISIGAERMAGYRQAHEDRGLAVDESLVRTVGFHEVDGEAGAEELLRRDNPPDALFCVNDPVAVGAYMYARRAGLSIPGDVALMGFSNNPVTAMCEPPLTTVAQPAYEIGRASARMLLDQFEAQDKGTPFTPEKKVLKTELIIRGST